MVNATMTSNEYGDSVAPMWNNHSYDENTNTDSLLASTDGKKSSGPKFQPGDHVIRWKMIKFMLWPIQVHGIVLSVDGDTSSVNGNCKYTIADFGYTSSRAPGDDEDNDENKNKNNVMNRLGNLNKDLNKMMKSFYDNSKNNDDAAKKSSSSRKFDTKIMEEDTFVTYDIETEREGGRKRFQIIEITKPEDLKQWHKIDYGKSLLKRGGKFKEKIAKSSKNLMNKLSFRRRGKNYSTLATDQDSAGTSLSPTSIDDDAPKLPRSDPHKIVLARTRYILSQLELPASEQTIPPYHIFYSNSECLAVWCKTGKFSTLQAAVFLHSTAVGNAKTTFIMSGAVLAAQPWLIPVVGIYGAVGIGMPYLLLKKCKERWSKSELKMTDGFWSTAEPEVFVAAVENWSSIDPSKKEVNDEGI